MPFPTVTVVETLGVLLGLAVAFKIPQKIYRKIKKMNSKHPNQKTLKK